MTKNNVVVEFVGDKWNGSLKIGGEYFSFIKGYKNPGIVKGDVVNVTLEEWESKGKKGLNITKVEKVGSAPVADAPKDAPAVSDKKAPTAHVSTGRDFDAEARGKCRHGMIVSLLPLVATQTITLERAVEVVNEALPFVMGDK